MRPGAHRAGQRWRETGSALVEVTWLMVLLLVPLLYIVLAVFAVQRSAFAVTGAARAAGRAFATAPSETAAPQRARAAADVALANEGIDGTRARVALGCDPDPDNCLQPGSVISVQVSYQVPMPLVPDALGGNTPTIRVEGVHRVPYGRFREDRP